MNKVFITIEGGAVADIGYSGEDDIVIVIADKDSDYSPEEWFVFEYSGGTNTLSQEDEEELDRTILAAENLFKEKG